MTKLNNFSMKGKTIVVARSEAWKSSKYVMERYYYAFKISGTNPKKPLLIRADTLGEAKKKLKDRFDELIRLSKTKKTIYPK